MIDRWFPWNGHSATLRELKYLYPVTGNVNWNVAVMLMDLHFMPWIGPLERRWVYVADQGKPLVCSHREIWVRLQSPTRSCVWISLNVKSLKSQLSWLAVPWEVSPIFTTKLLKPLIYNYKLVCLNFDSSHSCTCRRAGRRSRASTALVFIAQVRKHPRIKVHLAQDVLVVRVFLWGARHHRYLLSWFNSAASN